MEEPELLGGVVQPELLGPPDQLEDLEQMVYQENLVLLERQVPLDHGDNPVHQDSEDSRDLQANQDKLDLLELQAGQGLMDFLDQPEALEPQGAREPQDWMDDQENPDGLDHQDQLDLLVWGSPDPLVL